MIIIERGSICVNTVGDPILNMYEYSNIQKEVKVSNIGLKYGKAESYVKVVAHEFVSLQDLISNADN